MTEKEMAQAIGDLLLKYQVQVIALKAQITQNLRNRDGSLPETWGDRLSDGEEEPFSGLWHDKSIQLRSALAEATPDVPLIQILHQTLASPSKRP